MVVAIDRLKLHQKVIPRFINVGKRMKNASDGNTRKNIERERSAICFVPAFSNRIQRIAKSEVRGREATKAPKIELRLATSLTITTTSAETTIFVR
jgi:hypothetical protein